MRGPFTSETESYLPSSRSLSKHLTPSTLHKLLRELHGGTGALLGTAVEAAVTAPLPRLRGALFFVWVAWEAVAGVRAVVLAVSLVLHAFLRSRRHGGWENR